MLHLLKSPDAKALDFAFYAGAGGEPLGKKFFEVTIDVARLLAAHEEAVSDFHFVQRVLYDTCCPAPSGGRRNWDLFCNWVLFNGHLSAPWLLGEQKSVAALVGERRQAFPLAALGVLRITFRIRFSNRFRDLLRPASTAARESVIATCAVDPVDVAVRVSGKCARAEKGKGCDGKQGFHLVS